GPGFHSAARRGRHLLDVRADRRFTAPKTFFLGGPALLSARRGEGAGAVGSSLRGRGAGQRLLGVAMRLSSGVVGIAGLLVLLLVGASAAAEPLGFTVKLETVLEHDDGKFLWFHPRV